MKKELGMETASMELQWASAVAVVGNRQKGRKGFLAGGREAALRSKFRAKPRGYNQ